MVKRTTKKTLLYLLICVFIVLGLLVSVCVSVIFKKINTMSCFSYVSSLHSFLVHNATSKWLDVNSVDANWRLFDADEYRELSIRAFESGSLDIGWAVHEDKSILFDRWGNQVAIYVKKDSDNTLNYIVISKGKDGLMNTKDDISSPRKSQIPADFWANQ